jgi:hypothetical protein
MVTPTPSVLEPGATPMRPHTPRVSASTGVTQSPNPTQLPTVATPVSDPVVTVRVTRITEAQGEDGAGNVIAATRPLAIDLETEHGWPGGALSTVLYVGTLHFHSMGYPNITTMRFVVADEQTLPRDGEVALVYGARRRVIAPTLPGLQ